MITDSVAEFSKKSEAQEVSVCQYAGLHSKNTRLKLK